MTVLNDNDRIKFTLTATDQTLPTNFTFLLATDLLVTSDTRGTLTIIADYTVTLPASLGANGSITMVAATIGEIITIISNPPCTQLVDYVENARFPAEIHEKALDKLTLLVCRAFGDTLLSVRYPADEIGLNAILPKVSDRKAGGAGTLLALKGSDGAVEVISKGSLSLTLTLSNDSGLGGASPSAVNGVTQAAVKAYIDAGEVLVPQVAHVLTAGDVVRVDATFKLVKAKADTIANSQAVGIVSAVIDVDNLKVKFGGELPLSAHGFAAGPLYLSAATAGALTSTAPAIKKQVASVRGANTIIVVDMVALSLADQSGLLGNSQLFTSSGTFNVPAGVFQIRAIVVGGGGGGGGASFNGGAPFGNRAGAGSSGGGGGTAVKTMSVTPLAALAVTVGAGGAGGAGNAAGAGSDGSAGVASVFNGITGNGGGFGTAVGGNGAGGTGASGDYNVQGGSGRGRLITDFNAIAQIQPVDGGNSHLTPFGTGGASSSGGIFFGWNASGGVGASGAVLITW